MEAHPKGSRARVLLSSVFGPYAQDDEFGSRSINPMELYHNQVTCAQGSFSLRMFHRSWGIMLIQENISAPCTVLDFPTRDAFARELTTNQYDILGISSFAAPRVDPSPLVKEQLMLRVRAERKGPALQDAPRKIDSGAS